MIYLSSSVEEPMRRLFNLDVQLLHDAVLMLIAIFVLFIFLSYLLFNPARKLLSSRREKIAGELDEAKVSREEALKMKEEYEGKLKIVDSEAESILLEARRKALDSENYIVSQAKEEAARIVERARVEARLEKQKLVDDVKNEMILVASLMAGKIVSTSIDGAAQNRLIDETLKEMGESTWLS